MTPHSTRRQFLRQSSLVAMAPAIPSFLRSTAHASAKNNDERILDRLGAQRSAVELQQTAQAQKLITLISRVESLRRSQRAEINAAEANVAISQQDVAAAQQETEPPSPHDVLRTLRQRGVKNMDVSDDVDLDDLIGNLDDLSSLVEQLEALRKHAAKLAQENIELRHQLASDDAIRELLDKIENLEKQPSNLKRVCRTKPQTRLGFRLLYQPSVQLLLKPCANICSGC